MTILTIISRSWVTVRLCFTIHYSMVVFVYFFDSFVVVTPSTQKIGTREKFDDYR